MTRRATPPFRADHVGSLLRPPALLTARDDYAAGRIDAAALNAVEDEAIREALRDKPDDMAVSVHMCRGNDEERAKLDLLAETASEIWG
jgi:methionine synthase II (cobalamin-independent)